MDTPHRPHTAPPPRFARTAPVTVRREGVFQTNERKPSFIEFSQRLERPILSTIIDDIPNEPLIIYSRNASVIASGSADASRRQSFAHTQTSGPKRIQPLKHDSIILTETDTLESFDITDTPDNVPAVKAPQDLKVGVDESSQFQFTRPKTACLSSARPRATLSRASNRICGVQAKKHPKSAPAFTKTGYKLSIDVNEIPAMLYVAPFKVERLGNGDSPPPAQMVTTHNCRSRVYPRKQRRLDDIATLEKQLLEKYTLKETGLVADQSEVLLKTLGNGEAMRETHRVATCGDKCWPPRAVSGIERRNLSISQQYCEALDDASEIDSFAEEFSAMNDHTQRFMSKGDLLLLPQIRPRPTTAMKESSTRIVSPSIKNGLNEENFRIVAPLLLGESLMKEYATKLKLQTQDMAEDISEICSGNEGDSVSSRSYISIKIQDEEDYQSSERNLFRDKTIHEEDKESAFGSNLPSTPSISSSISNTSSDSSFTLSSGSSVDFMRNPNQPKSDEYIAVVDQIDIPKDYKKIYSELIDPRSIGNSLFFLNPGMASEDAVAETEMKIVLHDLQNWAQSKFSDLFKDNLEAPHAFLKSYEPPMKQLEAPSLVPKSRVSLVSTNRNSHSPSTSAQHSRMTSTSRVSMTVDVNSSDFDELIAMQPWRPVLEDEKGKGVSVEKKVPSHVARRLEKQVRFDLLKDEALAVNSSSKRNSPVVGKAKQLMKTSTSQDSSRCIFEDDNSPKRLRYGNSWFIKPEKWEHLIRSKTMEDPRTLEQKFVRNLLNDIMAKEKAAMAVQAQKLANLEESDAKIFIS
ncbi:hypothetical protein BC830DRAFT_1109900 [Chytriomyces sp. MP71]|nr:hypothetical protein BC830DRAFT_1109900 [Chytriomyces sp. MP71]